MMTLLYVVRLFNADSPVHSFYTGGSKGVTDTPCEHNSSILTHLMLSSFIQCTLRYALLLPNHAD